MKHPPASLRDLPWAPSPLWGEGRGEGLPSPAQVMEFLPRFVERALKERVRYRYVQPSVLLQADGSLRIEAPCCSRNVDPDGGPIDIAQLTPTADGRWQLCHRDHRANAWVLQAQDLTLMDALDLLCLDSERRFWP